MAAFGLTVIVADDPVKPAFLTQLFAPVTETSVYVVVLTTGVVKTANAVPLVTRLAVRSAVPSL